MFRKLLNSELGRLSKEEFRKKKKLPVVIVLDNIRSQHNIGAAFRSADAFCAQCLFLCGICSVPPTPEIHKSALGAEESMEWHYFEKTEDAILKLKNEGYKILSVEQTENSTMLNKLVLSKNEKYAFVFGNEVKGVAQEIADISDLVVEIPQSGTKHSINVSVSIGIVLWEAARVLKGI
ncbi:MAG: hypothetical protein ACD_77C00272G0013 [uncultured bacterium]|nr:MAG: hypothetical protein ACD_77C00272G0013 [uncultured bacterium]HBY01644.1 RNA methyltransferase [Rikenellaceae bacterium]